MGWVFAAGGLFAIVSAALDWDWFMNHRKARFFVRQFGRENARIFYVLLGTSTLVLGILMVTGVITDPE